MRFIVVPECKAEATVLGAEEAEGAVSVVAKVDVRRREAGRGARRARAGRGARLRRVVEARGRLREYLRAM